MQQTCRCVDAAAGKEGFMKERGLKGTERLLNSKRDMLLARVRNGSILRSSLPEEKS